MLVITSLIGSILGFMVCYRAVATINHGNHVRGMRICMLNSMSLAFVFAMFVELTTGSSTLSIIIALATVCLPVLLMMKTVSALDVVESVISNLMSASMSVMLIGMVNPLVSWIVACILVVIEVMLLLALRNEHVRFTS